MSDKIKIIATGLTGLIGSRLVELTSDDFDWLPLRRKDGFDITSVEKVDKAISSFNGEAVLHLAAFTDLNAANKERGDKNGSCYRINVLGTRNIARACQKNGKYLIHASTDAVFGGEKKSPYTEDDSPCPIEWYGQTKLWAEEEVLKSGCQSAIVRFAYPFRAEFEPKKDFVRKIIDQLKAGKKISMFSDTVFTPTFIDDIVPALTAILIKKPAGIFHVVGSTPLSPFAAAGEIAKVFGLGEKLIRPQKLDAYLEAGGRPYPRYAGLSNQKLRMELGVSMRTFLSALEEMKRQLS
jgi:dTDP-4-dehydrorhamnose reductase